MSRLVERLGTATWALIYGGMALFGVGLAVGRQAGGDALGWSLSVGGVVLVAIGIALVWMRSRLPRPPVER